MYSPKIREDLIPRIYRVAKKANVPMTAWVNQAVEQSLSQAALQPHNQRKENSYEHSTDGTESGHRGNLRDRPVRRRLPRVLAFDTSQTVCRQRPAP
jgi:hypothetical protein